MAVVVTYKPEIELLGRVLKSLAHQVESVVIVDNGSLLSRSIFSEEDCGCVPEVISLGENRGIAAAQNSGIKWAKERDAKFVLLLDQDSELSGDTVAQLLKAISRLNSNGRPVACVGPRYFDHRQDNPPPFLRIDGLKLLRCGEEGEGSVFPADYLISSGCLIPMSVIDVVGGLRDNLFIDYVDIEWGLRARRYGYQSYGVCSARMRHSLGEEPIRFFGRKIPLHTPLRHYYHFRNAVLVAKEPWVPWNWKLVDGVRLCRKYVFYSLFTKSRLAHWRMMTLGLWHGVLGRSGKLGGIVP